MYKVKRQDLVASVLLTSKKVLLSFQNCPKLNESKLNRTKEFNK